MIFTETDLKGAFLVDLERIEDERGFFGRLWCAKEFVEAGLEARIAQCNTSFNHKRGTLRGLHRQFPPHEEVKMVRCTKGALYDVIVDLRSGSETYKHWFGVELNDEDKRMLYVPHGFAHGYQTLVDETEAFYFVTEFYTPGAESGVRYDDPTFGIVWPIDPPSQLSAKDARWPNFSE